MLIAMAGVPSNEKLEGLLIERQCLHSPFDFRHQLFIFDSVGTAEAALELSSGMASGRSAVAGMMAFSVMPLVNRCCNFFALVIPAACSPKRVPAWSAAMSSKEKPLPAWESVISL